MSSGKKQEGNGTTENHLVPHPSTDRVEVRKTKKYTRSGELTAKGNGAHTHKKKVDLEFSLLLKGIIDFFFFSSLSDIPGRYLERRTPSTSKSDFAPEPRRKKP